MPANGTYLGIDYGTKHLGVAVGQSITQTATALTTLAANHTDFWSQLGDLITSWQPVGLVIGLPLNMDLTPQKLTTLARQFARACEKKSRYFLSRPAEISPRAPVPVRGTAIDRAGARARY